MCYPVTCKGKQEMTTQNFSIRLNTDIVKKLDEVATEHEWSRNYVISKFLKEKVYELTGES